MTSITRKVISKMMSSWNINPSTLNGAIDIIVVQQEDGTLRCTPFHVRFGKLGVFQNSKNKVYITINDNAVDDLYMQLGDAGEAVFIEENNSTPVLPPIRHLEPSDNNTYIDSDNTISLFPDEQSNIDCCSPKIINKELNQSKLETPENYISEEESKSTINIDVLHSNTILSTRRRVKRRYHARFSRLPSEDDEPDRFSSIKRQSRARKRDSTPLTVNTPKMPKTDERNARSITLLRKRSASEHDLPLFQFDFEPTPFANAHSRFHSIDSRPKTLSFTEITEEEEQRQQLLPPPPPTPPPHFDEKINRTLTNPISIEQIYESTKSTNEIETLNNGNLSKSAPSENVNGTNHRSSQTSDHTADFFSPTVSYPSPPSPRPTSPKSDTEYELDKSSDQANDVSWRWKWGKLPEQRHSVFEYFWGSSSSTSSTKPKPQEGIYLEDITSNSLVDRSLYLPPLTYQQTQQRTTNDDDQESGTGNSIPQSPFREHETSCLLGDVQLSLCANLSKQASITDEIFNAHLISFDIFVQNPAIINDPNLVVRIGGKYYNWPVASALITSASIFHKQLPNETIEKLQEKHMAQSKPRNTGGGWWAIPFYNKKSDMKNETPKTPTNPTATDVLAVAAKSETVHDDVIDPIKTSKNSKSDNNNSEQEDSEVRKLTDKIEQEKVQRQQSPSTQQTTLKKTMILSSDQLKRLNLKLGINKVEFSVTTAIQGTTRIESNIYLFDHMTKFVISDIDGTITRSDVLGHIIPLVGGDWSHDGIAEFFSAVQENGYQFIYLSARAIGQSQITRNFLKNVKQSNRQLPSGPLLISPDTLVTAFYREVIAKKPEEFKIECLKNIASLFPGKNPFYAGFGNRINDQWAYTAVGIPVTRIFTINPSGEVVREKLSKALSTSYKNLHEIVDLLFPPMDSFSASETYSVYTYWREESKSDLYEDEIRAELDEIARRQKSMKSNTKTKSSSITTPTVVTKPGGEKLLTIAQVTENNVKRA